MSMVTCIVWEHFPALIMSVGLPILLEMKVTPTLYQGMQTPLAIIVLIIQRAVL